jgi:hypothetical protein
LRGRWPKHSDTRAPRKEVSVLLAVHARPPRRVSDSALIRADAVRRAKETPRLAPD